MLGESSLARIKTVLFVNPSPANSNITDLILKQSDLYFRVFKMTLANVKAAQSAQSAQ